MKKWTEWMVDYNFVDGKCMNIRIFKTEDEANAFAKSVSDARVVSVEWESM